MTTSPVTCTLTIGQRADRELEWSDLAALALSRTSLTNGARSTYPLAMAEKIEDLASREMTCCGSWLHIEHERDEQVFTLTITTQNPDGVEIIRSFGLGDTQD